MKNCFLLYLVVLSFGISTVVQAQNNNIANYLRQQDNVFDFAKAIQDKLEEGISADRLKDSLEHLLEQTADVARLPAPSIDPVQTVGQIRWPVHKLTDIKPDILSKAVGTVFNKTRQVTFTQNFLTLVGLVYDIDPEQQKGRGWSVYADTAFNEFLKNPKSFHSWLSPNSNFNLCGKLKNRANNDVVHCSPDAAYSYHLNSSNLNAALEWGKLRVEIAKRNPSDPTFDQENAISYMGALVDLLEMEVRVGTKRRAEAVLEEAKRVLKSDVFVLGGDYNKVNELEKRVVNWIGDGSGDQSLDEMIKMIFEFGRYERTNGWGDGPKIINNLFRLSHAGKLSQEQNDEFKKAVRKFRSPLLSAAVFRHKFLQILGCQPFVKLMDLAAIASVDDDPFSQSDLRRELLTNHRHKCPLIARLSAQDANTYLNDNTYNGRSFFDKATLGVEYISLVESGVETALLLQELGYSHAAQTTRHHFWSFSDGNWDDEIEIAPSVIELMLHTVIDTYAQGQFETVFNVLIHINNLSERWMTRNWSRNSGELGGDHGRVKEVLNQSLQYWMLLSQHQQILKGKPLFAEAFKAAQLAQLGDVALAIQAGLRRSLTADAKSHELVLALEDKAHAVKHYKAVREQLKDAPITDGFDLAVSRAEAALEVAQINAGELLPIIDQYSEVAPITVEQIKAKLKPGEAFLMFVPVGNGTAAFYTDRYTTAFYTVVIPKTQMDISISALRKVLDPTNFQGQLPAYDANTAFALYQHLFGPLAKIIGGIKHFHVVTEGGLASLPLQVLIRSTPTKKVDGSFDLQNLDWFVKHHSVTTLTSPRNFIAKNTRNRLDTPSQTMIGFGDPIFNNRQSAPIPSQGYGSQLRSIQPSQLAPLPETRDELRNVARVLRADDRNLFFGTAASETVVKSLDKAKRLADYSVVYFATHGALPGQLDGFNEPGLIMSQPITRNNKDDGYLSASEIAGLRLNADWVVLSACNTAAGGTVGNQSLSGLSKAFFKAGARSLLVSHWEVFSQAAIELTGETFKALGNQETTSRAEALRLAMVRVMRLPSSDPRLDKAHPAYWAPFSIVGVSGD